MQGFLQAKTPPARLHTQFCATIASTRDLTASGPPLVMQEHVMDFWRLGPFTSSHELTGHDLH